MIRGKGEMITRIGLDDIAIEDLFQIISIRVKRQEKTSHVTFKNIFINKKSNEEDVKCSRSNSTVPHSSFVWKLTAPLWRFRTKLLHQHLNKNSKK